MRARLEITLSATGPKPVRWKLTTYRAKFMSLIKEAIQKQNPALFNQYFNTKKPVVKPYTFATLFIKPKFDKEFVEFTKAKFMFSSYEPTIFLYLYNHLIEKQKSDSHLFQNLTITKIIINKIPTITTEEATFQTLSPIIIRSKDNENHYLVPKCMNHQEDNNFMPSFRHNINQLIYHLNSSLIPYTETLEFEPLDCKFTLVKYEKEVKNNGNTVLLKFPAFRGTFKLKGNPELLSLFLQTGIGSRRSQGFGMVEIIQNPEGI